MKPQKIATFILLSIVLAPPVALCQTTARDYFNQGVDHFNAKQYDQAIADYTKAIELNPKYGAAYHNRGAAYEEKGQYAQAAADYTKLNHTTFVHAYGNR
jgi:tetratricopeptide (TPR) repeat protein